MKIYQLLILALIICGCGSDSPEKEKNKTATQTYWEDGTATIGLQVDANKNALYLAGLKYYATGVNCYDLFLSGRTKTGNGYRFDATTPYDILATLKRNGVTVLRFSCIEYYAQDFASYFEHRESYLSLLEDIAARAEEEQIGLIPSFFWNFHAVNGYFGEPLRSWGDPDSKTVEFIKSYTRDVVSVLAKYKSIFAWELGNELNLASDLPNWQEIFGTTDPAEWLKATDLNYAAEIFTQTVKTNDPAGRAIFSGHANLRDGQYNQYAYNRWDADSREQYKEITGLLTPAGMQMSEHIYETSRNFSDLGSVGLQQRLRIAKTTAAELGKAYYVGEFGGGTEYSSYESFYKAFVSEKIQLSLVWNFSINGDIEYSFTEGSEKGKWVFGLIKTYGNKLDELD